MKSIKKKLREKKLNSSDIEYTISKIQFILNNELKGHQNLSRDDIENLEIIKKLLEVYEEKKKDASLQTNHDNHQKCKVMLNELSLNQIITNPSWAIGGNCWFQIIDLSRFRDYLYKSTELILDKIPQGINFKQSFIPMVKKFLLNPWVIGIGCTVIGGIILALILSN